LVLSSLIFAGGVLGASITGTLILFGIFVTFTVFGSLRGGVDTGACKSLLSSFMILAGGENMDMVAVEIEEEEEEHEVDADEGDLEKNCKNFLLSNVLSLSCVEDVKAKCSIKSQ
jgi:hypothetical protein